METEIKEQVDTLLARIKNRELEALDVLYDLTSKILYRCAYSYLKNREDSEDALSNTFYLIAKNIDQYKGKNGFNWIYTICKNQSLDILRGKQKTITIDPTDEETINQYDLGEEADHGIHNKYNEVMDVAKEILKPLELTILLLHILDSLTFKEIAGVIHQNESTIRWKYNEILKKIRKELERRNISYE